MKSESASCFPKFSTTKGIRSSWPRTRRRRGRRDCAGAPGLPAANLILHKSNPRRDADLAAVLRHRVPVVNALTRGLVDLVRHDPAPDIDPFKRGEA